VIEESKSTESAGSEGCTTGRCGLTEEPDPKGAGWERSGLRSWGIDLLVSVIVSLIIIFCLYQPVRVEGTSMLPVLQDEDRLLINKFAYSRAGSLVGEDIQRGDVVVFYYPYDTTKSYIKRAIALPGDILRIDHGRVYVNDVAVKEPYVPAKYADERSQPEMVIPAGKYFMMGDHRSVSSDSREFGPVPRKLIYGRAAFVYWPVDQAGVVR
jgi:signal peptidase I